MKKKYFSLALIPMAVVVSCNKDEEYNDYVPPEGLKYDVIEYLPAPGQFINEKASGLENINTMAEACSKASSLLESYNYVSLGAWGGSLTIKLHSSLKNNGGYEFGIAGNSFDGSNEPGIVWVMQDGNGNGLPDDTWYELKGSYYGQEGYQKNYWVTYFRPEAGEDTYWEDSNGDTGYVQWVGTHHSQDFYYPNWVSENSYTLYGSKLPSRAEQNPITGIWENKAFDWGYVDNNGSDSEMLTISGKALQINRFKISNAITSNGANANLKAIDFIKVQTAINGSASILGENSTEICGFFIFD